MVNSAVPLEVPLQLDLPLPHNGTPKPRSIAWIVSFSRPDFWTAFRWLSTPSRSRPFFIDAASGSALVGKDDVVVLVDSARVEDHVCVPRSYTDVSVGSLVRDIVRTGKPYSPRGLTPSVHDGLLVRQAGGALRTSLRPHLRTPFEVMIERIATKKYRENTSAMDRICSRAIGSYDVSRELSELLQRVWAEAIAQGSAQGPGNRSATLERFMKNVSLFHARKLHHVGAQLENLIRRNRWLLDGHQLSLFEMAEDVSIDVSNTAIRHLPCSLIPVAYQTSTPISHSDSENFRGRGDRGARVRPIPRGTLKTWLREAVPSSLRPEVRISGQNAEGEVEIEIKLIPAFLHALGSKSLGDWKDKAGRGIWDVTPVLEGRPIFPRSQRVTLGESAIFRTRAVCRRNRMPLSLILLTPENGTYNIQLPDVA